MVFCHPWSHEFLYIAERARFHYGKKVVADIDDLISDMPSDHPDFAQMSLGCVMPRVVQAVDHVVFSTEFLKSYFGHMNSNITVIPNSISERIYKAYAPIHKPHKNCFIVGWTGGQSHRSDQLHTFLPGLRKFLRENNDSKAYFHVLCPDVLLKEFGSQVIYEPKPVEFLDYPGVAAAYPFSVCLVGLLPHNFNDAKSDLKLLEMAPNDILVIASPRSDFIRHKERQICLYADDDNPEFMSWHEAITFAKRNPEAVKIITDRAKEYVLNERLSTAAADRWDRVLESLL